MRTVDASLRCDIIARSFNAMLPDHVHHFEMSSEHRLVVLEELERSTNGPLLDSMITPTSGHGICLAGRGPEPVQRRGPPRWPPPCVSPSGADILSCCTIGAFQLFCGCASGKFQDQPFESSNLETAETFCPSLMSFRSRDTTCLTRLFNGNPELLSTSMGMQSNKRRKACLRCASDCTGCRQRHVESFLTSTATNFSHGL